MMGGCTNGIVNARVHYLVMGFIRLSGHDIATTPMYATTTRRSHIAHRIRFMAIKLFNIHRSHIECPALLKSRYMKNESLQIMAMKVLQHS